MPENRRNWAGNHEYGAARLHEPSSVEQVQELVANSRRAKALGTRHSFNDIADTSGDLISVAKLDRVIALDKERGTVTVEPGIKYGHLAQQLQEGGLALHNMASLPHISVAGGYATATHGSGDLNGNLATAVTAFEFVSAGGELVSLSRDKDGDRFEGAVVALGGLGVVTSVTLDAVPTFDVTQEVYEGLPFEDLASHFDEITSAGYSVSMFTDWQGPAINQVWIKRIAAGAAPAKLEPTFFGAKLAPGKRHPIGDLAPVNCTDQEGIPGPWFERLPHFRMDFTPSAGEELQSEYLVPREQAVEALKAVRSLAPMVTPHLQITEIRTVAPDSLWMSPSSQRESVCIHFTWKKDWDNVKGVIPAIETALEPFEARPHWGKLFIMSPERIAGLYEKLPDFRRLLQSYDPEGKFRNDFLDRYIFG